MRKSQFSCLLIKQKRWVTSYQLLFNRPSRPYIHIISSSSQLSTSVAFGRVPLHSLEFSNSPKPCNICSLSDGLGTFAQLSHTWLVVNIVAVFFPLARCIYFRQLRYDLRVRDFQCLSVVFLLVNPLQVGAMLCFGRFCDVSVCCHFLIQLKAFLGLKRQTCNFFFQPHCSNAIVAIKI